MLSSFFSNASGWVLQNPHHREEENEEQMSFDICTLPKVFHFSLQIWSMVIYFCFFYHFAPTSFVMHHYKCSCFHYFENHSLTHFEFLGIISAPWELWTSNKVHHLLRGTSSIWDGLALQSWSMLSPSDFIVLHPDLVCWWVSSLTCASLSFIQDVSVFIIMCRAGQFDCDKNKLLGLFHLDINNEK